MHEQDRHPQLHILATTLFGPVELWGRIVFAALWPGLLVGWFLTCQNAVKSQNWAVLTALGFHFRLCDYEATPLATIL